MTAEETAALVSQTLAWAARRAALPAFLKIAHQDDVVAIETLDGSLFELRVRTADEILWPRSNDDD